MTRADWFALLKGLLPALVVAAFTAWLTVRLALNRFYTERWWERKANTYSELLVALHDIVRHGDEFLRSYREGDILVPEYKDRLAAKSQEGSSRLAREAALGSFVVSTKAADLLEQCRKELWGDDPNDSIDEMIERSTEAARKCLVALNAEAKRDLRIPR